MIEELIDFNEKLVNNKLGVAPGCDGGFSAAAADTDSGRQGDLYFRYVNQVPKGYQEVKPFKKMVPGTTIGSKHCFQRLPQKCYVPKGWSSDGSYDEITGPIVVIDTDNALEHGQHGNITFQSCMIEFGYQKNYDVESEKIRRQQD